MQNPVLVCTKAITPKGIDIPVIPIVAKLGQGVQKFKLPFTAAHKATRETEFEFIFIKSVRPDPNNEDDVESLEEK